MTPRDRHRSYSTGVVYHQPITQERVMTDLKIFGEHDERTVAQMWRCMGVGSVAGGVL